VEENDDNLKKKSQQLQLLIEKYKKELDNVRSDCNHKSKKVKLIVEPGTSGVFRLVCEICDKIVGYPSKSDLDDFKN
jgi:hypothetical protein